jgi:hypothetical protein
MRDRGTVLWSVGWRLLLFCLWAWGSLTWAACYRTPQAAVKAAMAGFFPPETAGGEGYQVIRIERDPLLRRSWGIVGSCGHPEWSTIALPVSESAAEVSRKISASTVNAPVLVRAGETVRLWRREAVLQIEMAGVAEQNGALGATVRVRLARGSTEEPLVAEEFSGVVRGRLDVEMKP